MTTHQWTLQESFYFPAEYGAFAETAEVKVTPGFTEERTEDAIRLQGIYHIAANVVFDADKQVELSAEDLLVIDDVEVENGKGYFEYAVPLNVDLPAELDGNLELDVQDIKTVAKEDGGLSLEWTVLLKQEVPVQEAPIVQEEPAAPQLADASTSHMQFLENADRAVEQVQNEMEDFLLYIAQLDDDVTRKIFHSNNILVEAEGQSSE
ncbi:hypothetical protein SporoP37_02255 [Sporosarcina sp. P37]|uniref:hypothetical protein n=1 Tax=unclassified Sporosarcina TaxID=2647733 RepID=UPI0009BFD1CB|nr:MULTISPECIES: hypothetical protein [unclassified Sporosarcina]ARD47075.1 hypothetical protein SporoP33_01655 [Sporosarcina sp. P33]ARK23628.1 hypothetical protein SporoP37_02255 [Sporosarcina sp. P37]PID18749.1 hypothetical protein CSV62_06495 [Sporosarcina sp. P35]